MVNSERAAGPDPLDELWLMAKGAVHDGKPMGILARAINEIQHLRLENACLTDALFPIPISDRLNLATSQTQVACPVIKAFKEKNL